MSKLKLPFRTKEIAQPSWVRLAVATILTVATNTAGGSTRQHIVDNVIAHNPDHETRARLAEYFFHRGSADFVRHDFDGSLNNFAASNRALASPEMVSNIILTIYRSLGYQKTPIHPLLLSRATGEHSEWLNMAARELSTDPDYMEAIRSYENSVDAVDNANQVVTTRLVSGNIEQRRIAINKLRQLQTLVSANIARVTRLILQEGLGNTTNGMANIPVNTTCDTIPNFLSENAERFEMCNINLIDLREQTKLQRLVNAALAQLTSLPSQ